MINFLKNLFYNNQPTQSAEEPLLKENSISFVLNEDNKIIIRVNLYNTVKKEDCKEFGSLLYIINEGGFAGDIASVLNEMGLQEPAKLSFTSGILTEWMNLLDKHGVVDYDNSVGDDEPIISPLHFSQKIEEGPK